MCFPAMVQSRIPGAYWLLDLVCSDAAYTVGHVVVHCLLVYMKCHKQVHVSLLEEGPTPTGKDLVYIIGVMKERKIMGQISTLED